jgi:hypothetical protein
MSDGVFPCKSRLHEPNDLTNSKYWRYGRLWVDSLLKTKFGMAWVAGMREGPRVKDEPVAVKTIFWKYSVVGDPTLFQDRDCRAQEDTLVS